MDHDRAREEHRLVFVKVLYEALNPTGRMVQNRVVVCATEIFKDQRNAAIEEGELSKPLF